MNALNIIKSCRFLAMIAVVSGAMIATTVPVYAQQDVDPTWYNPWTPTATATQTAQPKVVAKRHQTAAKSTSTSTKTIAKVRTKRAARPAQS